MKNDVNGETDLKKLLSSISPELLAGEYVFYSIKDARYGDHKELEPIGMFAESEGMSLIIPKNRADQYGLHYDAVYKCISLMVHSSLSAVGLTAAVSAKLADRGVSANIIAAFYHDHIFVPAEDAVPALAALREFAVKK